MKKTILIVEDDVHIAQAQKLILENEFNIHLAADGEEGLSKAKEIKPDLVILDLMMPKMGGLEVCKHIRTDDSISAMKIVMVTAKNQDQDELRGMEHGADDYIMKPFEADELKHIIKQILQ